MKTWSIQMEKKLTLAESHFCDNGLDYSDNN